MSQEQSPETGDRPVPPGSPPILVDMSQQPEVPAPQGDRHVPGSVILVRDDQRPPPTAGEYRAAGYTVPESVEGAVPDDQVPGLVYADRWAPTGTVIPVAPPDAPPVTEEPEPPGEESAPDAEPAREEPEAPAEEPPNETREGDAPGDDDDEAGRQAAQAGEPRSANPHDRRTTEGKAWDRGWQSVKSAD